MRCPVKDCVSFFREGALHHLSHTAHHVSLSDLLGHLADEQELEARLQEACHHFNIENAIENNTLWQDRSRE